MRGLDLKLFDFFSLTFVFPVLNNDGKRCKYFISLVEVKTILKKTVKLETKRHDFASCFVEVVETETLTTRKENE